MKRLFNREKCSITSVAPPPSRPRTGLGVIIDTYSFVVSNRIAFTLAEVLITLAIVGIVAAITIPALTSKIQEAVINNQFKNFYSKFTNAFLRLQTTEGRPIKCFFMKVE